MSRGAFLATADIDHAVGYFYWPCTRNMFTLLCIHYPNLNNRENNNRTHFMLQHYTLQHRTTVTVTNPGCLGGGGNKSRGLGGHGPQTIEAYNMYTTIEINIYFSTTSFNIASAILESTFFRLEGFFFSLPTGCSAGFGLGIALFGNV